MANYRQIRRWNQSPDPDRSKKRRNKFTMSMWLSTWWVKRATTTTITFIFRIAFKIFEIQINLRLAWIWVSFKNHFLVLSIKFCWNQNKRMSSQKYESTHTQTHTQNNNRMKWTKSMACAAVTFWLKNQHFQQTKRQNHWIVAYLFLAKISFPGEPNICLIEW